MPKPSENAGMARLAHLQDNFAEALLSTTTPVPSCVKGAASIAPTGASRSIATTSRRA